MPFPNKTSPDIVVVGSINMDFVLRAPRLPAVGETVRSDSSLDVFPGGKGANQAHCAVRLGAAVAMIGKVGDDAFGSELVAGLAGAGINTEHVSVCHDATTGVALIVVDDEGKNTIVVSSGANNRLQPDDVVAAEDLIAAADLLVMQLEVPLPVVEAASELARTHGVTTLLNPAPFRPLPPGLLSGIDIIIPNQTEAASLTGIATSGTDGAERAAEALRATGINTVVVTRGCEGATLAVAGGIEHFPAHRVVAVDSTAAGDAFVGAFATALGAGQHVNDAVRFGNAAGAVATTRAGAQPSLPSRSDVETMMSSSGN